MTSKPIACSCGGEARVWVHGQVRPTEGPKTYNVTCTVCPMMTNVSPDREEVVAAWNRRAPSEAVGLLREVVEDTERVDDGPLDSKIVDNIRRFLAAQEGT